MFIIIKNKKNDKSVSFGPVTYDDVLKKMKNYWHCKSLDTALPTKNLKQNSDYFVVYFNEYLNQCVSKLLFPSDLKLADVTSKKLQR